MRYTWWGPSKHREAFYLTRESAKAGLINHLEHNKIPYVITESGQFAEPDKIGSGLPVMAQVIPSYHSHEEERVHEDIYRLETMQNYYAKAGHSVIAERLKIALHDLKTLAAELHKGDDRPIDD